MAILVSPVHIRLRHWREASGLSQVELAEEVGVSQNMISKIETGAIQAINLQLLGRLAKALKCEPRDLVSED